MKKYSMLPVLLSAISANAFQTPAQQSANIVNAVVASVLADAGLSFHSISKVIVTGSTAKVQLLNQNGECAAIPYVVKTSALGDISVEINKEALAICD